MGMSVFDRVKNRMIGGGFRSPERPGPGVLGVPSRTPQGISVAMRGQPVRQTPIGTSPTDYRSTLDGRAGNGNAFVGATGAAPAQAPPPRIDPPPPPHPAPVNPSMPGTQPFTPGGTMRPPTNPTPQPVNPGVGMPGAHLGGGGSPSPQPVNPGADLIRGSVGDSRPGPQPVHPGAQQTYGNDFWTTQSKYLGQLGQVDPRIRGINSTMQNGGTLSNDDWNYWRNAWQGAYNGVIPQDIQSQIQNGYNPYAAPPSTPAAQVGGGSGIAHHMAMGGPVTDANPYAQPNNPGTLPGGQAPVNAMGSPAVTAGPGGIPVRSYATGGTIQGQQMDPRNPDSVPIQATSGEFMVNKWGAEHHRAELERINREGIVSAMRSGSLKSVTVSPIGAHKYDFHPPQHMAMGGSVSNPGVQEDPNKLQVQNQQEQQQAALGMRGPGGASTQPVTPPVGQTAPAPATPSTPAAPSPTQNAPNNTGSPAPQPTGAAPAPTPLPTNAPATQQQPAGVSNNGFDVGATGLQSAADQMRASARQGIDFQTQQETEQLASTLAAHGILNSGAFVKGASLIAQNASNNYAQVESQIAQQNAAAYNNAASQIRDQQAQQQLMGLSSYYNSLSADQQGKINLMLQNGQANDAIRQLQMQQSFTAEQNAANQKWQTGERLSTQDFASLMQNQQFAQQFNMQKAQFQQQSGMQLSDQQFQLQYQQAQAAYQNGVGENGKPLSNLQAQMLLTDQNFANQMTSMAQNYKNQTGLQVNQADMAIKVTQAQHALEYGNMTSADFQVMMADKNFSNQSSLLAQQIFGNKDIQKSQQQFQMLMTEGSSAVALQDYQDKLRSGQQLTPEEQQDYQGLQDYQKYSNDPGLQKSDPGKWTQLQQSYGGGMQGQWNMSNKSAQLEFQRQLAATGFQMFMQSNKGAAWFNNLMSQQGASEFLPNSQGGSAFSGGWGWDSAGAAADAQNTWAQRVGLV